MNKNKAILLVNKTEALCLHLVIDKPRKLSKKHTSRDLEQRLIAEFKKEYGKRPFANLVD